MKRDLSESPPSSAGRGPSRALPLRALHSGVRRRAPPRQGGEHPLRGHDRGGLPPRRWPNRRHAHGPRGRPSLRGRHGPARRAGEPLDRRGPGRRHRRPPAATPPPPQPHPQGGPESSTPWPRQRLPEGRSPGWTGIASPSRRSKSPRDTTP